MTAGRLVVAILLIILGLAFLFGNLGVFDWDYLADLWRLWPLLLVILGISLFFGQRRRGLSVILIVLVLAVGAVIAVAGIEQGRGDVTESNFTGPPAQGITGARLLTRIGATSLRVEGGSTRSIVEADYRARGDVVVSDTGPGGEYEVEFAQRGRDFVFPFLRGDDRQFFDIRLASGVPWDLVVDVGAADADMDLRRITLRSLDVDAGASSLDVTVGPDTVDGASIVIEGGAGSFNLTFSRELTVRVHADAGLSSVDFDDDFEDQGDDNHLYEGGGPEVTVELKAGVSSLNVDLY